MEVSVFELLAAAREIQGIDYVDGDGIMCGKRYDEQTAHMIEFSSLEEKNSPARKRRYHRSFLTDDGYRQALAREAQGEIRIVRYASLNGDALSYKALPNLPYSVEEIYGIRESGKYADHNAEPVRAG